MANLLYLKFPKVQSEKTCHAKFQAKQSQLEATEKSVLEWKIEQPEEAVLKKTALQCILLIILLQ